MDLQAQKTYHSWITTTSALIIWGSCPGLKGQSIINEELNSNPLIQQYYYQFQCHWAKTRCTFCFSTAYVQHSIEWKSQELITSRILTWNVSGLLVFLRDSCKSCCGSVATVFERSYFYLNRNSHLNKSGYLAKLLYYFLVQWLLWVWVSRIGHEWHRWCQSQLNKLKLTACSGPPSCRTVRVFYVRAGKGGGDKPTMWKQQQKSHRCSNNIVIFWVHPSPKTKPVPLLSMEDL